MYLFNNNDEFTEVKRLESKVLSLTIVKFKQNITTENIYRYVYNAILNHIATSNVNIDFRVINYKFGTQPFIKKVITVNDFSKYSTVSCNLLTDSMKEDIIKLYSYSNNIDICNNYIKYKSLKEWNLSDIFNMNLETFSSECYQTIFQYEFILYDKLYNSFIKYNDYLLIYDNNNNLLLGNIQDFSEYLKIVLNYYYYNKNLFELNCVIGLYMKFYDSYKSIVNIQPIEKIITYDINEYIKDKEKNNSKYLYKIYMDIRNLREYIILSKDIYKEYKNIYESLLLISTELNQINQVNATELIKNIIILHTNYMNSKSTNMPLLVNQLMENVIVIANQIHANL